MLSAVGRDGNNQIYPIAWAVVSVENKDNWVWFMELLISDLGLPYGQGLTITSDQHKSRAYFTTDKAYDARGGNASIRGGKVSARGGKVSARGGKVSAMGGKVSATPSTPDSASIVVSSRGVAMQRLRPGVFIRSPEKVGPSYADPGSSSMNGPRTVNGKVVSSRGRGDGSKSRMYPHGIRPIGFGDSMGIPRPAWPEGITPQDCIIEAATQSEIAISQSPPVESQEQEAPMQEQPVQEQPLQEQPVQRRPVQQPVQRKSERIAQILFNKPPTPGPGLDPDDAISIE
ncbi:hypothetical protein Tco_0845628 [Tanacetum coccineum]